MLLLLFTGAESSPPAPVCVPFRGTVKPVFHPRGTVKPNTEDCGAEDTEDE